MLLRCISEDPPTIGIPSRSLTLRSMSYAFDSAYAPITCALWHPAKIGFYQRRFDLFAIIRCNRWWVCLLVLSLCH